MAIFGSERPTLNTLPDEILQQVFCYVSPRDIILNVQRVSKRLERLGSEPLLWRSFCKADYKYWDSKHRIQEKLIGNVGDVEWKKLYTYRSMIDTQTTALLDSILDGQINRIKKFDSIGNFGYDAKDALLRHCRTGEEADDVLSRRSVDSIPKESANLIDFRYYATAILDYVHRSKALAEWSKLALGEYVPIERALGSFDLFVLHDQYGDLYEVSKCPRNVELVWLISCV